MSKCERCERRVRSDVWLCRGCERLLRYSEENDWVVELGMAIKRFVRNAEVNRAVEDVRAYAESKRNVRSLKSRIAFLNALDLLVWHAKGGT